jgi:hypothetical protein
MVLKSFSPVKFLFKLFFKKFFRSSSKKFFYDEINRESRYCVSSSVLNLEGDNKDMYLVS